MDTTHTARGDDVRTDSFADLDDSVASLLARLGRAPDVAVGGAAGALPPLPPGTLVGENFEVVRRLGAGGMAVVYLARDRQLGRAVAIKLYRWPPEAGRLSRTMREAMAMARLTDPQVLTLYEVGEFAGRMYIAMEFVDGWNARDWQRSERPRWREVLRLYLRAGEGLAAAHAVGIVHCDFKPDNVLVGRDGRVRVADFGLARVDPGARASAAEGTPTGEHGDREAIDRLRAGTDESTVSGTPAYMAPEQREGRAIDARADQYAFCIALHEALSGRRPTAVRSDMSPETDESIPAWIARALRRGRDLEPTKRWPSMPALLAALHDDPAARRRRWLVGAGVAALLGLGAGAAATWAAPPLCADASARLARVWDDERRAQLSTAFGRACADERACPPEAHARTQALLDRYAAAWVDARVSACEATHVHGVQSAELLDRRMLCLDDRLRGVAALVDVLVEADAAVAIEAPTAAASLGSLATCADVAQLTSQIAPPDDPSLVPRVAAARARIDQARALRNAGRTTEALTAARGIEGEARRLGYPPLRAEVDHLLGELLTGADPDASVAHLLAAHYTATAHGHHQVSALSASLLVWNLGYAQSRFDEAAAWSRQALAETERRGTDRRTRIRALASTASMRSEQGRQTEALALQDQALALLGDEPPSSMSAALHSNRAAILDTLGRVAEARAEYEAVIAVEKELYGPRHPRLARTYSNLGLLRMRDAPHEAVALQREALAIFAETVGVVADDERWSSLLNFGLALVAAEQPTEALVPLDEALAITRRLLGPRHPHVGLCLAARSSALRYAGRHEEAISGLREALALVEAVYSPNHDEISVQQSLLAQALAAAGRPDEALPWFARAIAGWEQRGELLHPRLAEALLEQAEALQRLGRRALATVAFERVLAIAAQTEIEKDLVAHAHAGLAR